MKKHPIIQEYKNLPVSGLEIMKEQISFMASKMMDIEDEINISYSISPDDILIFNNSATSIVPDVILEQYYLMKKKYNYDYIKEKNIKIIEDQSQDQNNINFNTNWQFILNSNELLKDYLYHEFYVYNKQTEFYDILNTNYNIADLVKEYIDDNIFKKYRFKTFKLYTKYVPLTQDILPALSHNKQLDNDVKIFIKTPIFDIKAIPENKNKIEVVSIKPYIDGIFNIYYKQLESSKLYTFVYYFDVIYEKI